MNSSTVPDNRDVFDIKEKICNGSFGSTIFKAYNAALGQVAIAKKYPANLTNDYEGFMATLDQVRECRSPHVVTLYGYYKAVKYFWVVMEFCHGFSVHNLMAQLNRPLKESQIRTVVSHTLRGLEALHACSIVHTRIRASNILVTTFGVCKIAEPSPQVNISDTGVNVDGVVGNAYWSAPEILLQKGYRSASDIWSLGITVIELAERQPPYAETHPSRVMVTIPARPPPEFLNPDAWSKYLKVFLSCCLQKHPGDRLTATQLLQQKMIKKTDYKGMQTIVQKFIKMKQQQNSRFYTEPTSEPPKAEQRTEDVPLDEGVWAQSGTLVWSPSQNARSQENNSSNMRTTEFTNPAAVSPPQSLQRNSSFTPPDQQLKKPDIKRTKSSPVGQRRNNVSQVNKPASKPALSQSENRRSRGSSSSTDSDLVDSDTMKKGDFEVFKSPPLPSVSEGRKLPDPPDQETNLPSPGPVQPVPRLSKSSENVRSDPMSSPSAQRDKSNGPNQYNDKTVKVKEAENYTPSYMDFYKDSEPDIIVDVVEEVSESGMSRRNSIDQRGIKEDKKKEELKRDLDKVDMDYCAELSLLRQHFMSRFQALQDALSNANGGSNSNDSIKVNFLGKLQKHELTMMLKYMNDQHEEELKNAREHYDLEHRFLMNALRNTSDPDEEMRYNMNIRENNEAQTNTATEINRRFQLQTEDIMRAIERIDYADAIAVE